MSQPCAFPRDLDASACLIQRGAFSSLNSQSRVDEISRAVRQQTAPAALQPQTRPSRALGDSNITQVGVHSRRPPAHPLLLLRKRIILNRAHHEGHDSEGLRRPDSELDIFGTEYVNEARPARVSTAAGRLVIDRQLRSTAIRQALRLQHEHQVSKPKTDVIEASPVLEDEDAEGDEETSLYSDADQYTVHTGTRPQVQRLGHAGTSSVTPAPLVASTVRAGVCMPSDTVSPSVRRALGLRVYGEDDDDAHRLRLGRARIPSDMSIQSATAPPMIIREGPVAAVFHRRPELAPLSPQLRAQLVALGSHIVDEFDVAPRIQPAPCTAVESIIKPAALSTASQDGACQSLLAPLPVALHVVRRRPAALPTRLGDSGRGTNSDSSRARWPRGASTGTTVSAQTTNIPTAELRRYGLGVATNEAVPSRVNVPVNDASSLLSGDRVSSSNNSTLPEVQVQGKLGAITSIGAGTRHANSTYLVPNPGLNQRPEGQPLRAPVSASAGSTKTRSRSDPLRDSLGATVTNSVHCDHGTSLLLVPTRDTTSTPNAVCNAKSEPLVAFPPIFHSMQLPPDHDPEETSVCSSSLPRPLSVPKDTSGQMKRSTVAVTCVGLNGRKIPEWLEFGAGVDGHTFLELGLHRFLLLSERTDDIGPSSAHSNLEKQPDAHLHAHALIGKQLSIAREQHHKYWWDDMLDSESTEKETPTFAIQQQPARLQGGPPSLAVRGETNNSSSDLHQAEALVLSQKLQTGVVTSIEGDAQYQPEHVMVQHYEARRNMPHRIQSCSERGSTNFTLTQDSLVKQSAGLSDVVTYDSDSNSDSNPPTPKMRQHAVAGQRAAESSLINSDRRLSELWAHDYSPTLPVRYTPMQPEAPMQQQVDEWFSKRVPLPPRSKIAAVSSKLPLPSTLESMQYVGIRDQVEPAPLRAGFQDTDAGVSNANVVESAVVNADRYPLDIDVSHPVEVWGVLQKLSVPASRKPGDTSCSRQNRVMRAPHVDVLTTSKPTSRSNNGGQSMFLPKKQHRASQLERLLAMSPQRPFPQTDSLAKLKRSGEYAINSDSKMARGDPFSPSAAVEFVKRLGLTGYARCDATGEQQGGMGQMPYSQ